MDRTYALMLKNNTKNMITINNEPCLNWRLNGAAVQLSIPGMPDSPFLKFKIEAINLIDKCLEKEKISLEDRIFLREEIENSNLPEDPEFESAVEDPDEQAFLVIHGQTMLLAKVVFGTEEDTAWFNKELSDKVFNEIKEGNFINEYSLRKLQNEIKTWRKQSVPELN